MPTALAMGNNKGPNSTIAGIPSSTEPSTTKAAIEAAMKVTAPPGKPVIAAASVRENPDWVSPQAIAVAVRMMSRMAPERQAVETRLVRRAPQPQRRETRRSAAAEYAMRIVETSVAVATPSTPAARIKNGSARAGSATTKLQAISRVVARLTLLRSSPRYLQRITKHNKHAS